MYFNHWEELCIYLEFACSLGNLLRITQVRLQCDHAMRG